MIKTESDDLRHSVAFRVTEQEWKLLRAEAEKAGTTVPQMAKQVLFQQVGVNYQPKRSPYGHKR